MRTRASLRLGEHGGKSVRLNRVQWAGALLLAGGAVFVLGINMAESTFPGYSMSDNWVADLGGICTYSPGSILPDSCVIYQPAATFYSVAKLGLGVAVVAAAYLLYPLVRLKRPIAFLAVAGVCVFGAFVNAGPIQALFSLFAFLFAALAALDSYRLTGPPIGYVSVALSLVTLAAVSIYLSVGGGIFDTIWAPIGQGGMERVVIYGDILWVLVFGATLLLSPALVTASAGAPTEGAPQSPSVDGLG